jgi:sugar lactone lactonase YvrE
MTWQTVVTQPSELGESPFWHPDEQMLYWVDIPGKQIHRCNVFMGTVESWAMPSEPGSIAPARTGGDSSGLVIALRDGIYRAREWGAELQPLMKAGHDTATTRFNDGKADPVGRFWAGTMYEPRDKSAAELFSIDCRSSLHRWSSARPATPSSPTAWPGRPTQPPCTGRTPRRTPHTPGTGTAKATP